MSIVKRMQAIVTSATHAKNALSKELWKIAFKDKQKVLKKQLVATLTAICTKQGWKLDQAITNAIHGTNLGVTVTPSKEGYSADIIFKFTSVEKAASRAPKYRNYWPIAEGLKRNPQGQVTLYVTPDHGTLELRTLADIKKLPTRLPKFVAEVLGAEYRHLGD